MKSLVTQDIIDEIKDVLPFAPYKDEQEFISRAVEEKLLEYKKLLFFVGSEKVRKSLVKKKLTIDQLVKGFDLKRPKKQSSWNKRSPSTRT